MRKVLLILAVMALAVPVTLAAGPDNQNEFGIYGGYFWGDTLTTKANSPELDDDLSFGIYYNRMFTDNWGFQARLGYSPNSVTNLHGGDVDMDVTYLDLSATYQWNWDNVSLYVPFGLGYAQGSLDHDLVWLATGKKVGDDSGLTWHVGVGLLWPVGDKMTVRLDTRYRYIDKLVDTYDDSLDTVEATIGLGWTW